MNIKILAIKYYNTSFNIGQDSVLEKQDGTATPLKNAPFDHFKIRNRKGPFPLFMKKWTKINLAQSYWLF